MENKNPLFDAVKAYCSAFGFPVGLDVKHPDRDDAVLAIVGYSDGVGVESIWLDDDVIFADFGMSIGPCGIYGVQQIDELDIKLAVGTMVPFNNAPDIDWFKTARMKALYDVIDSKVM